MSTTDQSMMQEIQYSLIEPPDLGQTWPSGMWNMTEVVRYLNNRQDQFLKDTHIQVGMAEIAATQGISSYGLPDDWISTARVVWISLTGVVKELTWSDNWEADHGIPSWSSVQGVPKIYMEDTPLTITIGPIPNTDGVIQIYYIPTAAQADGTGEMITIQDEFTPPLKYGIMADMLGKVGRARDPRSSYCQQRFALGIEIARMLTMGFKK